MEKLTERLHICTELITPKILNWLNSLIPSAIIVYISTVEPLLVVYAYLLDFFFLRVRKKNKKKKLPNNQAFNRSIDKVTFGSTCYCSGRIKCGYNVVFIHLFSQGKKRQYKKSRYDIFYFPKKKN